MMRLITCILFLFSSLGLFGQVHSTMVGVGRPVIKPDAVDSLELWLKSDTGVSLNGSNVSSWTDQSSNGYIFSAAHTGAEPVYSTNSLNGYPVLSFDGGNDVLSTPTSLLNGASQGRTIFAVCKHDNVSTGYILTNRADTTGSVDGWQLRYQANATDLLYAHVGVSSSTYSGLDTSNYFIISGKHGQDFLFSFNVNGGITNNNNLSSYDVEEADSTHIGATINLSSGTYSGFLDGKIAEIIAYSTSLTNTERQGVEAYLAGKYNLKLENQQKAPVLTKRIVQPTGVDSLFYWFAADQSVLDSAGTSIENFEGVGTWGDLSGNSHDVTQVTAGAFPQYLATGGPNGKPTIKFDGTADYLASAAHFWGSDDLTVFVVMKFADATRNVGETIIGKFESTGNLRQWRLYGTGTSTSYSIYFRLHKDGTATNYTQAAYSLKTTTYKIHSLLGNGVDDILVNENGLNANPVISSDGIGDYSIYNYSQPFMVGAVNVSTTPAGFLQGSISEIIVYSKALTTHERHLIEDYLNDKYNLY